MKKWLLILILTMAITTILVAANIKVAVLPLKRLDSASKYIQNFLTIRDLKLTFDKFPNYELINMKKSEQAFKDMDILDIDEMEKSDMEEIGKELGADVIVLGVISALNQQNFRIQFRFYSLRSTDIKQINIEVPKEKKKRWEVLAKDMMGTLDSFISEEIEKINNLAIQDYNAENYSEAEKGFLTSLNLVPNNKQAFYYLGMISYKKKNYETAISYLLKSLPENLTKKDVVVLQNISDVYRDMGNKDMQIQYLVKKAQLEEDEDLWVVIANNYAELKQYLKAKNALLEALKINKNYAKAYIRMAFLLYDNGDYNESIPYLERASDENPDNETLAKRLADAYQKTGRIAESIARYENIITNNPNNEKAYLTLVGLYRVAATEASKVNNQSLVNEYNDKAINTLNRMKAIAPNNALMYLRFADVYFARGMFNDAENNANIAINKDGTLYQPYMILSSINQRRGTDKFNASIDLDKQFQKAVGRKADQLKKERDAARASSIQFLRTAEDQLRTARNLCTDPEVITDITARMTSLQQLIAQASKI